MLPITSPSLTQTLLLHNLHNQNGFLFLLHDDFVFGPETADDILLYAFQRPGFVIDVYSRRLLARLGLINGSENYETLRACFEKALPADVPLYNEFHALIVRHAKEKCDRNEKTTGRKSQQHIRINGCRHCFVEGTASI